MESPFGQRQTTAANPIESSNKMQGERVMTEQNHGAPNQSLTQPNGKPKRPTSAYRRLRRKFAQSKARLPLVWLRHRNFNPNDVFFCTYPKSGTTWVRFVLFEMLSGLPSGFKLTNELMLPVGQHSKAMPLLPGGGRLIGTHEHYQKQYHRAIYLVRDARDVVLSEWAYLKALEFADDDLDKFIKTFLFTTVSAFGPWPQHVSSWLDSPIAGTDNLLIVRFEDIRQDPMAWFTRIAEFLKVDVPREKIELAIANNSLEKMREKENKEPVRASIKGRFVRDGLVRGWLSKLTPEQVRFIEEHTTSQLLRLGYPLAAQLGAVSAHTPATSKARDVRYAV
jgi:hypothetical protein